VGLLREAGFVREEPRGGWTWLAAAAEAPAGLEAFWDALRDRLRTMEDAHGDDARLAEVLREREDRGVEVGPALPGEPGRSWSAWARALGHLLPALDVAVVGCGTGALALETARWARHVVGVDPDPRALAKARDAARRAGRKNLTWRRGPWERLPLEDGEAAVALLPQVLHRAHDPAGLVRESVRAVAPGGRVLVLDLLPHHERWVVEKLGHVHLGVAPADVARWLADAGLLDVRVEEVDRRRGNPFTVLAASGRRPGAKEAS
jgi:ArsR family transcriptional regulator